MTFDGRTATTAFMLALFVAACILSLGLPAKAAFMPLLVGIPGALLCAVQLAIDLRRPRDASPERVAPPEADRVDGRSEIEVFAWLALFAGALIGFGFVLGAPIVVAAFVRVSSRESWINALAAGAGTLAVMWGVFAWLLELSLFQGLILERLP